MGSLREKRRKGAPEPTNGGQPSCFEGGGPVAEIPIDAPAASREPAASNENSPVAGLSAAYEPRTRHAVVRNNPA
jgi:hypothetical protein